MFKRIMSFVLVLVMAVGMIPAPAAAAETSVDTSNMSLEGNNSLGSLLSDEIEQYQAQEESGAYGVVGLTVSGNTATVEYSAMEDAKLVVAIYTEDGIQMVTSGSKTVTAGEGEATVTIAGTMPEYFMAEAFLVDSYDYSPLCTSYSTPIYTKSMQELLASDVNDYEEELVLNLDGDESTNFLVYDEGTILVEEQAGVNTVLSANDETMTYVIGNADDTFLWLQPGDVVSYAYGEDQLLFVKVASIDVEGTTVTIQGAEITLDDVFSHIKIEDSGNSGDVTVDDSSVSEGVTYEGTFDAELSSKELRDINVSTGKTIQYKLMGHRWANGTIGVRFDLVFKYYTTPENEHIELRTDTSLTLKLAFIGKVESLPIKLGEYPIPVAGGAVDVVCKPQVTLAVTGTIEVSLTMKGTSGFTYSKDTGFKELNSQPTLTLQVKAEVTLSVTFDMAPGISALKGVIAMTVHIPVGVDVKIRRGNDIIVEDSGVPDVLHGCITCLEIPVDANIRIGVEISLFKRPGKSWMSPKFTTHICDMYYSGDWDEFGMGKCPHRKYLTTIRVKSSRGSVEAGARVDIAGETLGTTNWNGVVTTYLTPGKYTMEAFINERSTARSVEITGAGAVELVIPAPPSSDGESGGGSDSGSGGGTQPGDTTPAETLPGIFGGVDTSLFTVPGDAHAAGICGPNATFLAYDNGLIVISGTGPIAREYLYYKTREGWEYENQWPFISEVVISEGITEIGPMMFSMYANPSYGTYFGEEIKKVTIASTVQKIGDFAFAGCRELTNVKFKGGVSEMGAGTFISCEGLTSVYLPDGFTNIGTAMFQACVNLTAVRIPDTVTTISDNAFANCVALKRITIPSACTSIGAYAFFQCYELSGEIVIPEGVTYIGDWAFRYCEKVSYFDMPDSITGMGVGVFYSCNFTQFHIPAGLKEVPDGLLMYCGELKTIEIPENVTRIGIDAFLGCQGLTEVTIPDKVTVIDAEAFYVCTKLKTVHIPEGVTVIGERAFSSCTELTGVILPSTLETIGDQAFDYCKLGDIVIPASVTSIGVEAFYGYSGSTYIWFLGNPPVFGENAVGYNDCFYPANNPLWTAEAVETAGNMLYNWIPYTVDTAGNRIPNYNGGLSAVEVTDRAGIEAVGETVPETTVPEETVPETTVPEEMVPDVTVPEEAVPETTEPEETIPEATVPEETVPEVTELEETAPETTEAEETIPETTAEATIPENAGEALAMLMGKVLDAFALTARAAEVEDERVLEKTEKPVPISVEEGITEQLKCELKLDLEDPVTKEEATEDLKDLFKPSLSAVFGGEYMVEKGTTYSLFTATFSGLVPGEDYVLLDMASVSVADPLAPNNLLAIRQGTADSSGYLVFEYAQRYDSSSSYIVACGPSSQNLEEAFVIFPDMEANGELQAIDPSVEYYGTILTEGRDYVLLGQVSFTEAGTYTCYVRGIQNYTGLVKCTYTVEAKPVPQIAVTGRSSVEAGSSVILTAYFSFEPEAGTEVIWTLAEGDETYAALTPNGNSVTVTALDVAQTTVVTVTASAEGKALAGEFQLTITPRVPLAENIALYQVYYDANGQEVWFDLSQSERWFYELEDWMTQGFSIQLNAIVYPIGADSRVYWSSSDPAVANIDSESGLVSFTGNPGVVTFVASAADGSGVYNWVTFEIRGGVKLEPEGGTDIHLLAGKAHTFKILNKDTGKYINAKDIVWSIYAGGEDPAAFATVKNGKLTAQKVLTQASFWVYAEVYQNGNYTNTIEYSVTVYPAVTHMEVFSDGVLSNGKTVPFNLADTTQMVISAQMYPDDVMAVPVKWTISDNKNAYADYTIDGNTVLIRNPKNKNGTVTFKAESTDGSKKSATVKVQFATFAQSVTITSTETELNAGSSLQLSAYTIPEKPTKSGITWSLKNAADKNYASISSSGKLQGKTVYGETPVTLVAASKDGMASAEYTVTILPKDPGVLILKRGNENVTKSTINVDLNTETEIRLTALNFGTGEAAPVTWKSSSAKAAPVDENGVVTILGKGNVTITATGADKQKATVTLKIAPLASEVIAQEGAEVASGKAVKLTAQVLGVAKGQVTWSIVDGAQYGKISSSGSFTAGKDITSKQEVTVRATAKDGGIYDDTVVTLRPIAQGVQIYTVENGVQTFSIDSNAGWLVRSNTSYTWDINQGKTVQLSAHVYPYYGENHDKNAIQGVKWASSGKNVATVDENGLVTCLKPGTTTITATAADGSGKKVSFKLTVVKTITVLRMADQTVVGGKNLNLAKLITIEPSDATNKTLSWQILGGDGASTVTLSSKGELKTKKVTSAQTVRIRAEATDGSEQYVIFTVTINPA